MILARVDLPPPLGPVMATNRFVNGQIDVPQDALVLSVLFHIIADML